MMKSYFVIYYYDHDEEQGITINASSEEALANKAYELRKRALGQGFSSYRIWETPHGLMLQELNI